MFQWKNIQMELCWIMSRISCPFPAGIDLTHRRTIFQHKVYCHTDNVIVILLHSFVSYLFSVDKKHKEEKVENVLKNYTSKKTNWIKLHKDCVSHETVLLLPGCINYFLCKECQTMTIKTKSVPLFWLGYSNPSRMLSYLSFICKSWQSFQTLPV